MTEGAGGAGVLRLRCERRCRPTAVLAGVFAAFVAWVLAVELAGFFAWFVAVELAGFFAWFLAAELAGFGTGSGSPDASASAAMPVSATVAHPSRTHDLALIAEPFAMSERSPSPQPSIPIAQRAARA